MSKRSAKKAQEVIDRAAALDTAIAAAVEEAQRYEVSLDEVTTERVGLVAATRGLEEAMNAAEAEFLQVQARLVEAGKALKGHEAALEEKRHLMDQREHDMMQARARATALVGERAAMDEALRGAQGRLEKTTARRAAYQASQVPDPLADHPAGCRCVPCVERAAKPKETFVSPIKLDFAKGALGMDGAIKVTKGLAVQKFQTRMRAVVEEREGITLPPHPESMP